MRSVGIGGMRRVGIGGMRRVGIGDIVRRFGFSFEVANASHFLFHSPVPVPSAFAGAQN